VGVAQRREREREDVRRRILDAARDQFARHGYERVTMRAIAESIEYSATTIYNHFRDKDDLLDNLCEEDFRRLLGAMRPDSLPVDPVDRIQQLGRAYAAFGLGHPNHYRFMFMTGGRFENGHELSESGKRSYGLLRDAVREGLERGLLRGRDADTVAQVLWSSIHGAVALLITYKAEQFPLSPAVPDLVDRVLENSLRGHRS
jgi:AcrR family transcriptional regulator